MLLDTNAKINIITRKVIKDARLVIKQGSKLELVLYMGYSRLFLNLCKDIEVVISGLKTKYSIFIIELRDYDLVLEQLFLNIIKFN